MSFYCCLSYDDISGRVTIANVLLLVEITKYKYIYLCFILFLSFLKLFVTPLLNGVKSQLLSINDVMRSDAPATNCKPVVDNEFTCFPNTPFIVYVILMEHTKSNDC